MEQQAVDLQKAQADAQVTDCATLLFFLSSQGKGSLSVKEEDGASSKHSYFKGNSSTR